MARTAVRGGDHRHRHNADGHGAGRGTTSPRRRGSGRRPDDRRAARSGTARAGQHTRGCSPFCSSGTGAGGGAASATESGTGCRGGASSGSAGSGEGAEAARVQPEARGAHARSAATCCGRARARRARAARDAPSDTTAGRRASACRSSAPSRAPVRGEARAADGARRRRIGVLAAGPCAGRSSGARIARRVRDPHPGSVDRPHPEPPGAGPRGGGDGRARRIPARVSGLSAPHRPRSLTPTGAGRRFTRCRSERGEQTP